MAEPALSLRDAGSTPLAPISTPRVRDPRWALLKRALTARGAAFGGAVLLLVGLMALLAPWLGTIDPTAINPIARNKVPGAEFFFRTDTGERIKMVAWFGTDGLGRDVYSRVVYGARVSLLVGVSVALISIVCGLFIGVLAGFFRILDAIIMRIMDGLMAIPAILLAGRFEATGP